MLTHSPWSSAARAFGRRHGLLVSTLLVSTLPGVCAACSSDQTAVSDARAGSATLAGAGVGAGASGATASGGTPTAGSGAGGAGIGAAPSTGGTPGASGAGPTAGASGASGTAGAAGSGGATSTGGMPTIDDDALFAAPDGAASASGTIDDPMTVAAALAQVSAGRTIYLRGGTYALTAPLTLSKDGGDGSVIGLRAYPLDAKRPLLDFSAMAESSSNRGLVLSGDHWHVYGVDVLGAGDNGMFVSGSHNVIEYSTFSECADTGLQLGGGAADNLVLNCDSFYNADSSLENADGFAAKLDVGSGNEFVGCRAWNNLDDGWDGYLRPADDVTTTYESCWAIDNGKLKDGSVGAGDGNGFKTGGSDDKDLRHNAVYTRCIAAGNVHDGFDHNSNRGRITIINSAAHDNGSNFNFSASNIAASLTIENTLSLGSNGSLTATVTNISRNSWQDGLMADSSDFVSVDPKQLKGPRKSDGSLPDIDYLRLKPDSDLRNAGVDVGLDYAGSAPDVGPFESAE